MTVALKWWRVAVGVLSLALVALCVAVWVQPRPMGLLAAEAEPQDGGSMADRQRLLRAKQLLSQVAAASAATAATELNEFLEQGAAPRAAVVASGPDPDLGAVDYATLNVGVMRDGKAQRLIVGDESYSAGAKLPGGDVLEAIAADRAVIKRRSGRRITLKLDQ